MGQKQSTSFDTTIMNWIYKCESIDNLGYSYFDDLVVLRAPMLGEILEVNIFKDIEIYTTSLDWKRLNKKESIIREKNIKSFIGKGKLERYKVQGYDDNEGNYYAIHISKPTVFVFKHRKSEYYVRFVVGVRDFNYDGGLVVRILYNLLEHYVKLVNRNRKILFLSGLKL